jgi:hypothetical protein
LRGQFAAEPSWVDLRPTRLLPKSARLRAWQVAVAPLAAALHHTTVDQVLRDEDRVYRRNRRTAVAAVATLALLTVASSVLGITAAIQTGNARAPQFEMVTAGILGASGQAPAPAESSGDAE